MSRLRTAFSTLLIASVLGVGLLTRPAGAQTKPVSPPVTRRADLTPHAIPAPVEIAFPKALSAAERAKRARIIDRSLPAVLPSGATATLTPTRLRAGRVWAALFHVSIDARPTSPVATFSTNDGTLVFAFDGAAGGRFVIDLYISEDTSPYLTQGTYEVFVRGPDGSTNQEGRVEDGHLLFVVRTVRTGRYEVSVSRNVCCWQFYRLDLLRAP